MHTRITNFPTSYFGIAVGILSFGLLWRHATGELQLPMASAVAIQSAAVLVWMAICVLCVERHLERPEILQAEMQSPAGRHLLALFPLSTLLAALTLLPYSPAWGERVLCVAVGIQLVLGVRLFGSVWKGQAQRGTLNASVYLPVVSLNLVSAMACSALNLHEFAFAFFGAGMFAWLAIESMILNRAAELPGLPESERPLLGIQIAPPAVAGMSYLTISGGVPDTFVYMLWGYALYQALLAIRLLPWILKQKFTPAYWAFSFGGMSLATLTLKLWAQTQSTGLLIAFIATFLMANALMLLLTVNTLRLLWQGQLFPVPPLGEKT